VVSSETSHYDFADSIHSFRRAGLFNSNVNRAY